MYEIREMTISDYELAIELWNKTEGMVLSEADSRQSIDYYLNRNSGMSFVCTLDDNIIGTILCGHDGRRGYIYHVAVNKEHRGKAVAKKLIEKSLTKLKSEGITKCHIMVLADNEIGNQFWIYTGWTKRDGILIYSSDT
jgi:ribosomal protein S18 acetylase RimI-like enzyme